MSTNAFQITIGGQLQSYVFYWTIKTNKKRIIRSQMFSLQIMEHCWKIKRDVQILLNLSVGEAQQTFFERALLWVELQ